MVLLARGPTIDVDDLPPDVRQAQASPSTALVSAEALAGLTLDQWERKLIRMQLERCQGNRARVAKALGISERTLYRKLREYGLS
jgi:DNA-binding NtrC family response regulator